MKSLTYFFIIVPFGYLIEVFRSYFLTMEIESANTLLSRFDLKRMINELYNINATNCHLLLNSLSEVYLIEAKSSKYILKVYSDLHTNTIIPNGDRRQLRLEVFVYFPFAF
jgi:hypothetical protein